VKETLEKYIAPENIPRKYGGTLDYQFGMLPNLEPAIQNIFVSRSQSSDPASQFALPIGPVKWKEIASGELELLAVGSENGARRNVSVARIAGDFGFIHGISRANTQIDWTLEKVRTTTGTATQPAVDGDPEFGRELLEEGSGAQTPADGGVEAGGRIVPVTVNTEAASDDKKDAEEPAVADEVPAASDDAVAESAQPVVDLEPGEEAVVATLRQAEEHRSPDGAESKSYVEQAKDAVTSAASAAATVVDQALVGTGLKAEHNGEKAEPGVEKTENGNMSEKPAAEVEHDTAQAAVMS
jgi:hypothetical protein